MILMVLIHGLSLLFQEFKHFELMNRTFGEFRKYNGLLNKYYGSKCLNNCLKYFFFEFYKISTANLFDLKYF